MEEDGGISDAEAEDESDAGFEGDADDEGEVVVEGKLDDDVDNCDDLEGETEIDPEAGDTVAGIGVTEIEVKGPREPDALGEIVRDAEAEREMVEEREMDRD